MNFKFGDRVNYLNSGEVTYIGLRTNTAYTEKKCLIQFDNPNRGWTYRAGDGRSPTDPRLINLLNTFELFNGLYWVSITSLKRI